MATQRISITPQNWHELLAEEAREWQLTTRAPWLIAAIPIFFAAALFATIPYFELFSWLTGEDSVIETFEFLLLLCASVLFAANGLTLVRRRQWTGVGVLYLFVALGAFFVAGEEISWGQRVFGWDTPGTLQAINAQDEITVHNIFWAHRLFIWGAMIVGIYGTLLPLLNAAFVRRANSTGAFRMSWLFIPPLCLVPAFAMAFGYRLVRMVMPLAEWFPRLAFPITRFAEVTELCLYYGLLVFAWLIYRRLQATTMLKAGL